MGSLGASWRFPRTLVTHLRGMLKVSPLDTALMWISLYTPHPHTHSHIHAMGNYLVLEEVLER